MVAGASHRFSTEQALMHRSIQMVAASVILWVAAPNRAIAQTQFDGVITFHTHSYSGNDATLIQSTSGNKLRLETIYATLGPGTSAVLIADGDAHTLTMLMPGQRHYVRFTEDQMKTLMANGQAMAQQMAETHDDVKPRWSKRGTITISGRTDTVLGVSCDVYRDVRDPDSAGASRPGEPTELEVCVANGVGFVATQAFSRMIAPDVGGASPAGNASSLAQWAELLKGGRGILKVTSIDGGQSVVRLIATNIDRSPPNGSVFEVPPGYTQFGPQMGSGTEKQATVAPWSPRPHYPEALRSAGTRGTVMARFRIDTTGHAVMGTFEVLRSDNPLFSQAVKDALPYMIFYPAEVDGRKVPELVSLPFSFAPN